MISPVLFLILQSIGKNIFDFYTNNRPSDISVYYAGNFNTMDAHYAKEYAQFFDSINSELDSYNYFIKTDIREFYNNINMDKLFYQINKVINNKTVYLDQKHLQLFKTIFNYCGDNHFPLVENSVASSYLATVIYLEEIDIRLRDYIINHCEDIIDFKIVRYVDDLYILIRSEIAHNDLTTTYNQIIYEYSSLLKEYDLAINKDKVSFKRINEIKSELKKPLYGEFHSVKNEIIPKSTQQSILIFLKLLKNEYSKKSEFTNKRYNQIIEKAFANIAIEFTPHEILNYYIYEDSSIFKKEEIIDIILDLIEKNTPFIYLDPKRLTILIMQTRSEIIIKTLLRKLFERYKNNLWNSYDTTIAINYLIQRKFKHLDLITIIKEVDPKLYAYYKNYCKDSLKMFFEEPSTSFFCKKLCLDKNVYYLHLMYQCELVKGNVMSSYAYYKNFFDRTTAHMAFKFQPEKRQASPHFSAYYKETQLKRFYAPITDSDLLIKKAYEFRRQNPLTHASAELLDNNNSEIELVNTINDLNQLMFDCFNYLNNSSPTK